jgi:peptidoglycan/LPS O-acetylase OafA/YrhL
MLKPGLVRFLLASIVIFYHLSGAIYIGTMSVFCFFILSGYWVTFMYEKKYINYKRPVTTFYLSRIFRLFPVYLLIGTLTIIMSIIFFPNFFSLVSRHNVQLFWLSNVFLLGYNQLSFKPIVPAWSLDIELQFYVFLPLLLAIGTAKINRTVMLCMFGVITVLISVFYPFTIASKTIAPYLSYFFIGVFIYKSKLTFSRRTEIIFNSLMIVILLTHYSLGITHFYTVFKTQMHYESYFNQLISLLLIPLLSNCVNNKSDNLDRILGEMSYVLYLTHWLLIIPYNHVITGLSKFQRIPVSAGYLLLTYILSYIIFKYYDKPIDKIRREWLERKLMADKNKSLQEVR